MIIQCPNCDNKIELRDDKLKLNSVKVRCSKCKEVFTVVPDSVSDDFEEDVFEDFDEDQTPSVESPADESHTETPGDEEESGRDNIAPDLDIEIEKISLEDIPDTHDIEDDAIDLNGVFKPGNDMDSELEKTQIFVESEKSSPKEPFHPQKRVEEFDLHKYFDLDRTTPGGHVSEDSDEESVEEHLSPVEDEVPSDRQPTESLEAEIPEASASEVASATQSYKTQSSTLRHQPPALFPSEKPVNKLLTIALPAVITLFLIIIILGMLLHFNVFKLGSESGRETISSDVNSISELNGYYVINKKEGKIFIIDGKFTNTGPTSRSFAKISGKLYDSHGNLLISKESYCGNVLTKARLESAPKTEIELKLNNQYGLNNSNVNLKPGATIPFQVAFFKLTHRIAEFNVECLSEE